MIDGSTLVKRIRVGFMGYPAVSFKRNLDPAGGSGIALVWLHGAGIAALGAIKDEHFRAYLAEARRALVDMPDWYRRSLAQTLDDLDGAELAPAQQAEVPAILDSLIERGRNARRRAEQHAVEMGELRAEISAETEIIGTRHQAWL